MSVALSRELLAARGASGTLRDGGLELSGSEVHDA